MGASIKLQDHYLDYLNNIQRDLDDYNEELTAIAVQKENLYKDIDENKEQLKEVYGIAICDTKEWIEKKYNGDVLYNKVNKLIKNKIDNDNIDLLFQLNKYLLLLKKEKNLLKNIEIAKKRNEISSDVYQDYIKKYYYKVHEFLLQGLGYQFRYGIGIVVINFWKKRKEEIKPMLDFYETKKAKKALIEQGFRPYSKKEAEEYAKEGIPYDGVPYAVYKNDESYYELRIYKTNIRGITSLIYTKIEHVDNKLKGLTFQQIADEYVNSFDDIVNLDVSLKNKITIMKLKYPNSYLKFIRTTDAYRFKSDND